MTAQPDYHDWPDQAEVAEALHISTRAVERLATQKKIAKAYREVPHKRATPVYNPDDVARLAGERRAAQPFVAPLAFAVAAEDRPVPLGGQHGRNSLAWDFLARMMETSDGAAATVAASTPKRVDLETKIYLTLDEAVEFSGLTKAYLLRAIEAGGLTAVKSNGWRIQRESLKRL
jgi:hypothetical protein